MDSIVPTAECRLWLPGLGAVEPSIRRAARAVRDYDESLRLAKHEITGDWVVVIGDGGHPVLGLGREIPHVEEIRAKLEAHDTKRHGKRIMDELARDSEKKRLDAKYRADEQNYEMAEHYLSARRRLKGETGSLRGRTPYLGGVKNPYAGR